MTKQYHFYLNDDKTDDQALIDNLELLQNNNMSISALVKDLLKAHFKKLNDIRIKQDRMDFVKHMR